MKKLTRQEIETTRVKVAKYIRNNVRKGHYPGFLEIKKKFRIGLHTYFKDIAQAYELAGLKYNRSNFWKKRRIERKRIIKKRIITLIKEESARGKQLTKREIESKLRICLHHYFKNLREAYKYAGVEYKPHFGPRTKEEKTKIRRTILSYIKKKVESERYFPDIHELRRKFRVGTETYFPGGIKEIIEEAGFKKEKFSAFWRLEKEKRLLKIAQYILERCGYKIISKQNKIGPDMIAKKNEDFIPIELKAFRKNSYLPPRLVPRDPIIQTRTYIRKLEAPFGIIITTADDIHPRYKNKIPENVKIWFYKDIIKLLLSKSSFREDLEFIRTTFPRFNSERKIREVRQRVAEYIRKQANQDRYLITREIQEKFKINLLSYFDNIFEAYELAGVKYPDHKKRMGGGNLTKEEKQEMRNRIISFTRRRKRKNLPVNYRIIQEELRVAIPSYFSSMQEIYKKANV